MSHSKPSKRSDFQIGILCALPLEYDAVSAIFDGFWDEQNDSYGQAAGDPNIYTTGQIGTYNVVLALLGHMGKVHAASAAAAMRSSYSELMLVLLVGVCAGMPYNHHGEEIILGDIVIGKIVIQSDFGRKHPDSFAMKNTIEDGIQKPGKAVRNLIASFETQRGLDLLESRTAHYLEILQAKTGYQQNSRCDYNYPGVAEDKLFDAAYRHKHRISPTDCLCRDWKQDFDPTCLSAPERSCLELGCEDAYLIIRTRLQNKDKTPFNPDFHQPAIHIGRIASADTVMRSAKDRDTIHRQTGVIAFEMEAAGIWDEFESVIVVKGVCDYADSHKNKAWQQFAAASAAAASRAILERYRHADAALPLTKEVTPSVISSNQENHLLRVLPEQCDFVGRQGELQALEDTTSPHPTSAFSKSIVALWGLSGVGKSQLVSEFIKRQWSRHGSRHIFWISGTSEEAFEQSIIDLLKDPSGAVLKQREALVRSFFSELGTNALTGSLLVVDGLSASTLLQKRLQACFKEMGGGVSVIITTRSKEVATQYLRQLEVQGLDTDAAVEFVERSINTRFRESEENIRALCGLLKNHPLSLTVATSLISRHLHTIPDFIRKWNQRLLADSDFSTHNSLHRAFELSFEELEKLNPISAKLLMLFSFLDHRDLWYELCFNITDVDSLPEWLRQVSSPRHTFLRDYISPMHNLSFIEAKPHEQLGCVYEIHPAVHEFARWKASQHEKEYLTTLITLVATQVPRSTDRDFVAVTQRIEPHVDQCMMYIRQGRTDGRLDLMELEKFANLYRHAGRYKEARQLYRAILGHLAKEERCVFNDEMMANIENNLGLVYHAEREYDQALEAFDRAIQIRRQLSASNQEEIHMMTLYNQGRSLLLIDKLAQAQEKLQAAADYFSEKINSGCGERQVLQELARIHRRILNDLGETYLRSGHLELAKNCLEGAFQEYVDDDQGTHPAAFAVRLNMGRYCVEKNLFASARNIFEHIIKTYTQWWGRRHPETVRAISELADCYHRHGRLKRDMGDGGEEELKRAAEYGSETLQFYEEMFGRDQDITRLTSSKLQELRMLASVNPNSEYDIYCT